MNLEQTKKQGGRQSGAPLFKHEPDIYIDRERHATRCRKRTIVYSFVNVVLRVLLFLLKVIG